MSGHGRGILGGPVPTSKVDDVGAWVSALVAAAIAVGLVAGPPVWRSGPSMMYVRHLGLPWAGWSVVWLAYGIAVLVPKWRVRGFLFGLVPWGFYTFGILTVAVQGHLLSIVGAGSLLLITLGQFLLARWASIVQDWRALR